MNKNMSDLRVVIDGLNKTKQSMSERIAQGYSELNSLKLSRKTYIEQEVNFSIKNISKKVKADVELKFPGFIQSAEEKIFDKYKPFLWIFFKGDYSQALATLRIRLTHYIDKCNWGHTQRMNEEIRIISGRVEKLEERESEISAMIATLSRSLNSQTPLDERVARHVEQMARKAKSHKSGKLLVGSSSTRYNQHSTLSHDDSDDDLWLYMLTDIPTSVRTLMLSSINHQQHNSYKEEVFQENINSPYRESTETSAQPGDQIIYYQADGDKDDPEKSNIDVQPDLNNCDVANFDQGNDQNNVPVDNACIATDDSLGAYS